MVFKVTFTRRLPIPARLRHSKDGMRFPSSFHRISRSTAYQTIVALTDATVIDQK